MTIKKIIFQHSIGYDTVDSVQPTAEQPLGVEDVLHFMLPEVLPSPVEPEVQQAEAGQEGESRATIDNGSEIPTVAVAEQTEPAAAEEGAGATGATARKRKSRWGVLKSEEGKEGDAAVDPNAKPKRKSRFQLGPPENSNAPLANSTVSTIDPLVALRQEMLTVQTRLRELQEVVLHPATFSAKGFDGPSPDPIYDSNGKRVNTRESRVKDFIKKEQQELVARAIELQVCPIFIFCFLFGFFTFSFHVFVQCVFRVAC